MKTNATQMEIMILTNTSFAARPFADRNENAAKPASEKDALKEACWNGMLFNMLPEIIDQVPVGKRIYLWDIKEADTFIELELGETAEETERFFSINPYVFIAEQSLS